jgi:cellulose synthase (UDP-forming)
MSAPRTTLDISLWADRLGPPHREDRRTRRLAHLGGIASITALVMYLTRRILFTVPTAGAHVWVAWTLIVFEALPLVGLVLKTVTLWTVDSTPPMASAEDVSWLRVVLFIPTYNEPAEVIAPTIAAAVALEPAHETWVLDDGDRPWVQAMCADMGARYVSREVHDHAKAGNMNHALGILAAEDAAGVGGADVMAVVDCDHVPLPHFLTATLGWFADADVALVQGPQAFYNAGAFDDDGMTGEQGLFFNVLMPARHYAGAGPFWCGSTSLLRVAALREIGGVATETITEDMHTTLKLMRAGWRTVYHHQTLAVGLAPATAEQYLLQRRRWGMGAMQILVHERLWAAKRWMSWRNFYEYLNGTLWWLEGIATLIVFAIPMIIIISGVHTSTAHPLVFSAVFLAMFTVRLWGARKLLRDEIHWPTAFALRVYRIPVGMACLWWLLSRKVLEFEVTPKGGADDRQVGRTPVVIEVLLAVVASLVVYAFLGVAGVVPWNNDPSSTVASGIWLAVGAVVLVAGTRRIESAEYATSRRNAYRAELSTEVLVDGVPSRLLDVSVGGAAVRSPGYLMHGHGPVSLTLPGAAPMPLAIVRRMTIMSDSLDAAVDVLALRAEDGDWLAMRDLSLWMFHTPDHAVAGLPAGVPAVAARSVPNTLSRTRAHPLALPS